MFLIWNLGAGVVLSMQSMVHSETNPQRLFNLICQEGKNVFHLPFSMAWFREISSGYCRQHMPNGSTQIGNKRHLCSLGIGDLQAVISSLWLSVGTKLFHAIWACLKFCPLKKKITQTKTAHLLPTGAANCSYKSWEQKILGDHGTRELTHLSIKFALNPFK